MPVSKARISKVWKKTIKVQAEAQGESLNAFINRAITETVARDGAITEGAEA